MNYDKFKILIAMRTSQWIDVYDPENDVTTLNRTVEAVPLRYVVGTASFHALIVCSSYEMVATAVSALHHVNERNGIIAPALATTECRFNFSYSLLGRLQKISF